MPAPEGAPAPLRRPGRREASVKPIFSSIVFAAVLASALLSAACQSLDPQTRDQVRSAITGCPRYEEEAAFPSAALVQIASRTDEKKEEAAKPEEKPAEPVEDDHAEKLDRVYEEVKNNLERDMGVRWQQIENQLKGQGVSIQKLTDSEGKTREIVLAIDGDVNFPHGRSNMTQRAEDIVNKFAAALGNFPDAAIKVGGHTDSTGSRALNLRLSQSRAETVRDGLVNRGIARGRFIEVRGYADDFRLVNTRAAEPRNRRVEIRVIPPAQ